MRLPAPRVAGEGTLAISWLRRYACWLHTAWPAGRVEKLPVVRADGSTNVPGLYVAGDLTGLPLLKLAALSGAAAVRAIAARLAGPGAPAPGRSETPVRDLVIVGAGVAGCSAALEARKLGLDYVLLESAEPFSTIVNFPRAKPIFTYPSQMSPASELRFGEGSRVKEGLLEELRAQTVGQGIRPEAGRAEQVRREAGLLRVELAGGGSRLARAVLVAIGRSGDHRRLAVPGEERDKVANRLHDPQDFRGQDVLVVGGGDSAAEAAVALARAGARVTLSYRGDALGRPKQENRDALEALAAGADGGPGSLRLLLGSQVRAIGADSVALTLAGGRETEIPNQAVFVLIGREAPLDFFRRSGVRIAGEWRPATWAGLAAFLAFCTWLYHWKSYGFTAATLAPSRLVQGVLGLSAPLAARAAEPSSLLFTLVDSARKPAFYYTLAYCLCVGLFGWRRIRRRRTPYVTVQTLTLVAIQVLPLFLLPEILLPWLGRNGWFAGGPMGWLADQLFPGYGGSLSEREYWRAYGLVLAWPLMVYNWFTAQPLWGWLVLGSIQTFALIPLLVHRFGKGAYCGWICSCGALAETLGDGHRAKMPHGSRWNRLNLLGQVILGLAFLLLAVRILGWVLPAPSAQSDAVERLFALLAGGYTWGVDVVLAGILGVGLYFHFSGRVWCRFACPLAALMHIYARFGRFRILADKKRCISCNACTAICHQGIDVMSFANKGLPMADPQCVRCSACVQACPTGVLAFGQVAPRTGELLGVDRLAASPVRMVESDGEPGAPDRHGLGLAWRRAALGLGLLVLAGAVLLAAQVKATGWPGEGASAGGPVVATRPASGALAGAAASQPTTQPATRPAGPAPPAASRDAQDTSPAPAGAAAARFDHAAFDRILAANVRGDRVDYAAIRQRHLSALDAYLDSLGAADPARLAPAEQVAFYINLYNASMIQAVIDRWEPGWSPADGFHRVFREKTVTLGGRRISLDELEKGILLPAFRDPRLHVALVCAARGCPPLLPRAYRGDDLETVLEDTMRRFLRDPARNRVDRAARRLYLSKIFEWYAADFGGKTGVAAYVARYLDSPDVASYEVEYLDYDWTLNQAEEPAAPAGAR